MAAKRGKIDFFKKTKVKKEIITKFIHLYNAYIDSKGYEYSMLTYNIEFDDKKSSDNVNERYQVFSPKVELKLKTDPDYESLLEIHNKILLSAVDFKEELGHHSMTVTDFEFLNDLDKRMKEKLVQESINDMERENALGNIKGGDWYEERNENGDTIRYYKDDLDMHSDVQ